MPTTRTRRSRARRGVDAYRVEELLHGPGVTLLAGQGYCGHLTNRHGGMVFSLDEISLADRAAVLAEMRTDWIEHRDALMDAWTRRDQSLVRAKFALKAELGGPATRPWSWWRFDAPQPLADGETEAAYLTRHHLLLPGERETGLGAN